MPTREVVGYFDKLNDVCGDFVDTKNQWGDNICSIVEKVQEKVDEHWSKDVESEEEYDSTDFSFSFAMNSRTERYVADGLLVTFDGKTKVNDMLNCIGNEDFVTIASFSEEKGKIVAVLAEEECAEFHLGLKFFHLGYSSVVTSLLQENVQLLSRSILRHIEVARFRKSGLVTP
ncbi:hypothetical protein MTR67_035817 [Solanum verrucosum]|uniref:Uncharacterized protein n=1 Tax=Solanum verrucosum TaxID=315347 RepID=A0AAF0UAK8_SOLVR|nr:hypothetical protein MTR67_035817 [Solanum verrucosum]